MIMNSIWISIIPLLIFNVFMLATAVAFRPVYRSNQRMQEVENRHASKLLNRWMREYWFWLTDPLVRFFIKFKFTPNVLTGLGTFIGILSGVFFWKGHFGLGGWMMILGASFDMFDGRVARLTKHETKSGAYFDSVMDRISEGAGCIGLVLYYQENFYQLIVMLCFLGSIMVSYAKSKGDEMGAKYSGGTMQRPERIVYLGVGAIFSPVFAALINIFFKTSITTEHLAELLYLVPLSFVALMTWATSFDRMRHIMKMLDAS